MAGLLVIHIAAALAILWWRGRVGRRAFLVGSVGPLAVLVWAIFQASGISAGTPYVQRIGWVPSLDLTFDLRVDAYSLAYLLVIAGAGVAIFIYAARYFSDGSRVPTFAATMTIFAGAMVGIVVSDHLLSIFVFWELTTITSYLLIGYDDHKAQARSAALHAALITGAGGLAMLGGFVLLADAAGSYLISDIVSQPPAASTAVTVAWLLILLGAVTKSAQFPFHAWLPGAMSAPTPASAFLHSATMVKAGIFLVGRLGATATATADWWQPVILVVGFITMVIGGWRALRQTDLKLLLAFGTVSQLGFLFLLIGSGSAKLVFGGLALLVAHALFKAALFMVVGTIDHQAGTRDIRRLSGLRRSMPGTFWTAVAAAASMAAVPLTYGFVAKEAAFDGLVGKETTMIAAAAAASILTVVYSARFLIGAFGPHEPGQEPAGPEAPVARSALLWSPLVLAGAGIVLGFAPRLVLGLVDNATVAVTGVAAAGKLVLWPGLVPALGWSALSLAVGAVLVARPPRVDAAVGAVGTLADKLPTGEGTYRRALPALLTFADRSSGILQNGSLPAYIAIIVLVAVALPAAAVVGDLPPLTRPPGGIALEWMLGALIVGAAISLVFVRRRFAVVILLGGVGYGIAGLYAILGGPDLSLTQLLVETLAIALFAFVLRHLPGTFNEAVTARIPRIVVALTVGSFVFAGGLLANTFRGGRAVADSYLAQAVPEAAGSNVVNVILVDFRGFDTLGEITVLVAATLGVAGLAVPALRMLRREG